MVIAQNTCEPTCTQMSQNKCPEFFGASKDEALTCGWWIRETSQKKEYLSCALQDGAGFWQTEVRVQFNKEMEP